MAKWRKPKASELSEERKFVGEQISFEEAFPEIEEVSVEVKERGKMFFKEMSESIKTYHKKDIGEYIDCSYHACVNGGFSIGNILREMVREKQTEREIKEFCQGYESSPKGRNRWACGNYFDIKAHIIYKKD